MEDLVITAASVIAAARLPGVGASLAQIGGISEAMVAAWQADPGVEV